MPYRDLFTLAIAAAPCGIAICDDAGQVAFCNATFERMFGADAGTLNGTSLDDLIPGGAPLVAALTGPQVATSGQSCPSAGRRVDGTLFPLDMTVTPAMHGGRPLMLAAVIDASTRRGLEEQLADQQAFEQAIADVAASFVSRDPATLDERIVAGQRRIGDVLQADRSALWQYRRRGLHLHPPVDAGGRVDGASAGAIPGAGELSLGARAGRGGEDGLVLDPGRDPVGDRSCELRAPRYPVRCGRSPDDPRAARRDPHAGHVLRGAHLVALLALAPAAHRRGVRQRDRP